MLGPSVQVYTAMHPISAKVRVALSMCAASKYIHFVVMPLVQERAEGLEFGKPITIGADVWVRMNTNFCCMDICLPVLLCFLMQVGGAAVICPGVTIGDKTVIGAGSIIVCTISSYDI